MQLHGTTIADEYAEAFTMWATRLIVTAVNRRWVDVAADQTCGYGTSIIGCDAEAGIECRLEPQQTPDGRPGAALLCFARTSEVLGRAVANRVGQCLMTCPTTAVYDGLEHATVGDGTVRLDLGKWLRYFGDGHEQREVIDGRPYWRIPVTEGEFLAVESIGAVEAVGGGNFLICGTDQAHALDAAERAADSIAPLRQVITPFPGGIVRCASKAGSRRYRSLTASTNDAYCPTLRGRVDSKLPEGANCVYEIVIDGLTAEAVAAAMKVGITAACRPGVVAISAGNYGGKLGKVHLRLHEVMG